MNLAPRLVTSLVAVAGALAVATAAHAARIVGNGGVGVFCPANVADSGKDTTEVLDYYQARREWQIPHDLGDASLDELAKVKLVLDRVKKTDPMRGSLLQGWFATWAHDSVVFNDHQSFGIINDYGDPRLQDGCHVEQIAVQQTPANPDDRRYLIDGQYWTQLDVDNKAGLILHELVFRDALRRGQTDSRGAHYLTAVYSSQKFADGIDPAEYALDLRDYDLDAFLLVGHYYAGHTYTFRYFDGKLMTSADAKAFCEGLGPGNFLVDGTSIGGLDSVMSAIGEVIVNPAVPFWSSDLTIATLNNLGGVSYTASAKPTDMAAVICSTYQ